MPNLPRPKWAKGKGDDEQSGEGVNKKNNDYCVSKKNQIMKASHIWLISLSKIQLKEHKFEPTLEAIIQREREEEIHNL
jgi:hypothetical protein